MRVSSSVSETKRKIRIIARLVDNPISSGAAVKNAPIALYGDNSPTPFIEKIPAEGGTRLGYLYLSPAPNEDVFIRTRILGGTGVSEHEFVFPLSAWFPDKDIPNNVTMVFIIQCISTTDADLCTGAQAHPYMVFEA